MVSFGMVKKKKTTLCSKLLLNQITNPNTEKHWNALNYTLVFLLIGCCSESMLYIQWVFKKHWNDPSRDRWYTDWTDHPELSQPTVDHPRPVVSCLYCIILSQTSPKKQIRIIALHQRQGMGFFVCEYNMCIYKAASNLLYFLSSGNSKLLGCKWKKKRKSSDGHLKVTNLTRFLI